MFGFDSHRKIPKKTRPTIWIVLPVIWFCATRAGAAPLDQPTPDTLAEARRIVHEMKENQRGPYRRILWFCDDGTTQPPVPYACRERGGGRQHAEYSEQRERLAELGWSVGTIFAAMSFDELVASQPRQGRLRQLALERYLTDIDNGWVLRRAQAYRGRVQVEDEEARGRELLLRLVSDTDWALSNFLLVREAVRVIPHGEDTDLARSVRRAAIELAELEPAAERWRAEIHSSPNASTAARLRSWLGKQRRDDVIVLGEQLANDLDLLYGPAGRHQRIAAALKRVRGSKESDDWRTSVTDALSYSARRRVQVLCQQLSRARSSLLETLTPAARLALVDAMQGLETEVQLAYQESSSKRSRSRSDVLSTSSTLLECAHGSGLLSARELESIVTGLHFGERDELSLADYRTAVVRLKRAPVWALGTIRFTFAEALTNYTALDPRAARFSDDVLRGSPMWLLGDLLRVLAQDADRLSGSVVEIAGQPIATAVALNAGIARGRLRIFKTIEELTTVEPQPADIVALPETIAELSPVAGILTLGEGNALSHVQLLARNFGIPNVAIDRQTVDMIQPLEGDQVLLVVGSNGDVIVRRIDQELDGVLEAAQSRAPTSVTKIEVPVPDLGSGSVLRLEDIGRELSGRVVGPKAANLGELNRLFPGRVAPAIALPFGIYARHVEQAGLMYQIADVFAARAAGTVDASEFDERLSALRRQIAALRLQPDTRDELIHNMALEFGEPETYGVFVRSDTNVEDLPQFTGAGLNETVPNVVGLEKQLDAVSRVWSSILSPRAIAWRSSVLENPAQIYASVLLMQSVPATKSGVLVTSDLFERRAPGVTATAAWGVGGAVGGEAAETIIIREHELDLVSEAKTPYQRQLAAEGGVQWVPANAGAVLQPQEIQQLRDLALEVGQKYAPALDDDGAPRPWDIEFGFVDGELTLFQIRPLVERTSHSADALIRLLKEPVTAPTDTNTRVRLDKAPE